MITSLVLENFKSFRNVDLQLGPLTLLIGPNASGKSNLRDALRFLHAIGRGYSLSESLDGKYEGAEKAWDGVRGGAEEVHRRGRLKRGRQWYSHRPENWPKAGTSLDIVFESPAVPRLRYRITFAVAKSGTPRVTAEMLCKGSSEKEVYSTHPATKRTKRKNSLNTIDAWYPARARGRMGKGTLSAERPVLSQLPHEPETSAEVLLDCSLIRTQLLSLRFLDLSPSVMRNYSHKEQGVLGSRGENLSGAVWRLCQQKSTKKLLLEWLKELTPHDVDDIDFYEAPTGEVLLKIIEPEGREVSARSMSDGTLRYLALATALLGAEKHEIFFIEEIENGIHPTRLYLLIQMIQQITSESRTQVIATTHAPLALAFLDEDTRKHALYCYRNRDTALSEVAPVMKIPHIKEALEVDTLDRLLATGWMEHAT